MLSVLKSGILFMHHPMRSCWQNLIPLVNCVIIVFFCQTFFGCWALNCCGYSGHLAKSCLATLCIFFCFLLTCSCNEILFTFVCLKNQWNHYKPSVNLEFFVSVKSKAILKIWHTVWLPPSVAYTCTHNWIISSPSKTNSLRGTPAKECADRRTYSQGRGGEGRLLRPKINW